MVYIQLVGLTSTGTMYIASEDVTHGSQSGTIPLELSFSTKLTICDHICMEWYTVSELYKIGIRNHELHS